MRIGISTSVIQRGRTGIAQYLFALVRAFLPYVGEHQFTLFVLEEDLPLFDFVKGRMEFIPVAERFRPAVKNILWHQRTLPQLAGSHRLDVLHVPSYRRMLWRKPCPLVATIHDLAPFTLPGKYDWKRMIYGRLIARRLAQRQDQVIAISQNTASDLRRFFRLPPERITVVYNGLEHERFFLGNPEQAKSEAGRRYGLQKRFFLYVARLEHPGKNHVRLISAFNEFKAESGSDWQLVFAGSDWHGAEAIHHAIQISPVSADIRCLGFVLDEQLPELYRAADIFIFPSLYEGFGLPALEAMACGCPVICSARGSLGEVVGNAAIIVDPENVRSISSQLLKLAADDAEKARLVAAGLERVKEFDWKKTAAATLKVYETARKKLS